MSRRRQYPTVWRSGDAPVGSLRGRGIGTRARPGSGTGETRLRSFVSKDRSYKPMVKSSGAQRESDGVVVPAGGEPLAGKGSDFGHVCGAGTREGMAGAARSISPGGREPFDKVRRLQRKLWAAAKRSPERRFHALADRVYRGDVLVEAWRRVRANRGAAGVDRLTLAAVEEYGVERMLDELGHDLRSGTYRSAPTRRVTIPKADGGRRPLSIPTVRDRVAQQATRIVLEPIFEADFLPVSYGFRPRRSATQAAEVLREGYIRGYRWVVEFDIRDCFGSIDQVRLLGAVQRRVSDRRVVRWIRLWLRAGMMEEGAFRASVAGTPQGGVISPLLANIYLHAFDQALTDSGVGELVRYADDGVVLCRSKRQAEAALALVEQTLAALGLQAHPVKTRIVDLTEGRDGFDFLGWHFRPRVSGRLLERGIRRYYLHRWPSQRAMKAVRAKIRDRTGRHRLGVRDIRVIIAELNPILRGWGNYFRTGNAGDKFIQLDRYVAWRLKRLLVKKRGRNLSVGQAEQWTSHWLHQQGLYRLMGTIRYPEAA
jgi:RNA-directed DNA polymerase